MMNKNGYYICNKRDICKDNKTINVSKLSCLGFEPSDERPLSSEKHYCALAKGDREIIFVNTFIEKMKKCIDNKTEI